MKKKTQRGVSNVAGDMVRGKGMLIIKDVAELTGLSRACVAGDVKSGVLPAKKLKWPSSRTGFVWGIKKGHADDYVAAYGNKKEPKKESKPALDNGAGRQLYVPVGIKLHKRVQNLKDSQITKCSAADVVAVLLAEALETRGY